MGDVGDKEDAVVDSHRSPEKTHSEHSPDNQQSFQIRPPADSKFQPSAVQEHLHSILSELLSGKKYALDEANALSKVIANTIRNRIKAPAYALLLWEMENLNSLSLFIDKTQFLLADRGFKRYRYVVDVVLGEKRGAGVKVGARCLWDADTDNYVSTSYTNDTLFCVAAVFAVYTY